MTQTDPGAGGRVSPQSRGMVHSTVKTLPFAQIEPQLFKAESYRGLIVNKHKVDWPRSKRAQTKACETVTILAVFVIKPQRIGSSNLGGKSQGLLDPTIGTNNGSDSRGLSLFLI